MTVANLGDSRAYLDTGCENIMLTVDHRVATHTVGPAGGARA